MSVPHRSIAAARVVPIATARAATSAAIGAGATDSTRIPASWVFRATGKAAHRPIEPASDDDRQLRLEIELALGEQGGSGRPAEPLPGVVELRRVGDPELTSPVIAADRQLEPERQAELPGGGGRLGHGPDFAPRRDGDPGALDEPPLGQAVLGDDQRPESRPDRDDRCQRLDHVGGDMLELVGDDRAQRRPAAAPPRRRRTSR